MQEHQPGEPLSDAEIKRAFFDPSMHPSEWPQYSPDPFIETISAAIYFTGALGRALGELRQLLREVEL